MYSGDESVNLFEHKGAPIIEIFKTQLLIVDMFLTKALFSR